jgi:hypothetical protein
MIQALKESEVTEKRVVSPSFTNAKDAIAWLDNSNKSIGMKGSLKI